MSELKSKKLHSLLVILLFAVSPFVMSLGDVAKAEIISANVLPVEINQVAGTIRWILVGIISILSVFIITNNGSTWYKVTTPVLLFSTFYLIQLLYAIVDGYDVLRFTLLTIFSFLIPPFIGYTFRQNTNILKYLVHLILIFLIISLVLNGQQILYGHRFLGFLNNPNTYGISSVFWTAVILLLDYERGFNKKYLILILIALIITLLFSGSRNAMVGMAILLLMHFHKHIRRYLSSVIPVLAIIFICSVFIDLSQIGDRIISIPVAYQDSGRYEIWNRAFFAIQSNLWMGNGMDANYLIADTGNMHNCYIRLLLNMGLFYTLIALSFYFKSIHNIWRLRNSVPIILPGFLIAYTIMNLGEDFFVGLGSSTFIYVLFILGFVNYYIVKNASSR